MKKYLIAAAFALSAHLSYAGFPDKPITIVNPFAAGGLANNLARVLADGLAEKLGQPVIVESKPGAGGIIGFNHVKGARADGHTLIFGTISTLSLAPSLNKQLPFDASRDFIPVAMTFTSPNILVVNASSKYRSLADLAKAAKSNPRGLTFAITGNGTTGHILGGTFKALTGANMIAVAYKGSAPAITGMLGGEIDFWFGSSDTLPHIESGKLRALAVASKERYSKLPQVPTTAEAGYRDLALESWYGVLAPAGTPADVVNILNQAIGEVLASPKARAQAQVLSTETAKNTSQAYFADRIRDDEAAWRPLIQRAAISAE
jgi:tripartite-type tricarboxylate transporter receptor subunit TctC